MSLFNYRNWKIYFCRQSGETYKAICADYKLSRSEVRHIVNLCSWSVDCLVQWWNSATQEQREQFAKKVGKIKLYWMMVDVTGNNGDAFSIVNECRKTSSSWKPRTWVPQIKDESD